MDMTRDGAATRLRILDVAHDLVLDKGFAATSLDQILAASGVTKGAFFHHFASKDDLAAALFDRYLEGDRRIFEETVRRAGRLSSDPLQQVLITIGLFEEMYGQLHEPHPGCLIAAFAYQNELMTPRAREEGRESFLMWRDALSAKLKAAEAVHPPRVPIDHDALADMLNVIVEGGFIMAKVYGDAGILVRYLRVLRTHIELVFGVAVASEAIA